MVLRLDLDEAIHGTGHFVWREVLHLPTWRVHVYPPLDVYYNLIKVMSRLHWIREFFGKPVTVTSGYRPVLYNKQIGGAFRSAHKTGEAVDFQVKDVDPDEVRRMLLPLLDHLDLRMEDLPGASWVHIDIRPPINHRYFKP